MTTLPRPESPPNAVRVSADTVLITGAATGIGALAARSLAPRGHTVYASMRDPDGADASRAEALREGVDGDIRTLELDVLNDATVDAAVGRIIEESGRIDVLVNNAGHMYYGITEAFTPDELMSSYATNCAGRTASPARCYRTCADSARACRRGSGRARLVRSRRTSDRMRSQRRPSTRWRSRSHGMSNLSELTRQSSIPASSPKAPVTSPMRNRPPTPRAHPNTTGHRQIR